MATTKAISGNPTKNDGGTVTFGGNSAEQNAVSLSTLAHDFGYGSVPVQSSNIGTTKVISGGEFAYTRNSKFVGVFVTTSIAGVANTTLRSPGTENAGVERLRVVYRGNRRLDYSSWDYVTGELTKGANAGAQMLPIDPDTGNDASPESYVPAEFVMMTGGVTPTTTQRS